MYISKKLRQQVYDKFGGLCAYSGTPLEPDWQVDHLEPLVRNWWLNNSARFPDAHCIDNMVPCQKIINHYKGSLDLETFRRWFLGGLHERLAKLPKNPRTDKSVKKIAYLRNVANYFGISEDKPFCGTFYFETLTTHLNP